MNRITSIVQSITSNQSVCYFITNEKHAWNGFSELIRD